MQLIGLAPIHLYDGFTLAELRYKALPNGQILDLYSKS